MFSIHQHPSTGWWLSHPSEKYEFVNWDDEIPNISENMFQGTSSKYLPTSIFTNASLKQQVQFVGARPFSAACPQHWRCLHLGRNETSECRLHALHATNAKKLVRLKNAANMLKKSTYQEIRKTHTHTVCFLVSKAKS